MNDESRELEDHTNELRQRYQSIEAPPYIATRIRAHTHTLATAKRRWRPAFAIAPIGILAIGTLAFFLQQETKTTAGPALPSFAALAGLTPEKPASAAPGMSRIKTVSTPRMPRKPKSENVHTPQSKFESTEFHNSEENQHDYV